MASLDLKHIYKVYPNGAKAVNDFNMEIPDKEFVVLVGPSGCGKSTTLRMIAGLEEISAGELYVDGVYSNNLQPADRDMAMVFQNYALYPHMTIYDNIAFGLKIRKMPKEEIDRRVQNAAKILGITEYLKRKPKQMSGGQRQRVALGRAIVREPKVMLLDEPLSNLDAKLRTSMRSEISKLHKKLNTTFIYVTHDQVEAMTMGTVIVIMKDGFVQQIDRPQNLYNYPLNKFVAGFIGTPQMNFFNVTLTKTEDGADMKFIDADITVHIPPEHLYKVREKYMDGKTRIIAGIRAEDVSVNPAVVKNSISKVKLLVSNVEQMGSEALIYGDVNPDIDLMGDSPTRIIIKAESGTVFNPGDVIEAALNTAKLHIFDGETEKTLIPHMVEYNDIACEVEDGRLKFLGQEISLPPAIICPDGKGYITVPSDAITIGLGGIPARIVECEEINNKYLVGLDVNGKRLYCVSNKLYEKGDMSIFIDIKRIAFEIGSNHIPALKIESELVGKLLIGRYDGSTNTVKHANKTDSKCYLSVEGVISPLPDEVGNKITANYTKREALKRQYKIVFSPEAAKIAESGISGSVESILDYGKEKFASVKVGENTITVAIDSPISGNVHITLDYNNVGIVDMKNDIKLV